MAPSNLVSNQYFSALKQKHVLDIDPPCIFVSLYSPFVAFGYHETLEFCQRTHSAFGISEIKAWLDIKLHFALEKPSDWAQNIRGLHVKKVHKYEFSWETVHLATAAPICFPDVPTTFSNHHLQPPQN
jgi:hypothetical protein